MRARMCMRTVHTTKHSLTRNLYRYDMLKAEDELRRPSVCEQIDSFAVFVAQEHRQIRQ
eukprot:COSAG02_NODE_2156_length_9643_cov_55.052761_3_plen_59_part_00